MYVVKGRVRKSARDVLLCHPVTSILVEVCMRHPIFIQCPLAGAAP